jgi:hypothetical protein
MVRPRKKKIKRTRERKGKKTDTKISDLFFSSHSTKNIFQNSLVVTTTTSTITEDFYE